MAWPTEPLACRARRDPASSKCLTARACADVGCATRRPGHRRPSGGCTSRAGPAAASPWPARRLRWPDFWLPLEREDARSAFAEAHRRAAAGLRVEIACDGGRGRTGTALACIAQFGGVSAEAASAWVRRHYDARAVETPWQRWYVRRFEPPEPPGGLSG